MTLRAIFLDFLAERTGLIILVLPFRLLNPKQALDLLIWRKGQDSNLRGFRPLVFKTSAINHSATFPPIIIPDYSAFVYTFVTSSRSSTADSNFSNFSAFSPSTGTYEDGTYCSSADVTVIPASTNACRTFIKSEATV